MSSAIILSQGTELTTGQTFDSNAHWICQQLWNLGYSVEHILILPDDKAKIIDAFRQSINNASLIISTGGLGPTSDDFTSECLAKAFNLDLNTHPKALSLLQDYYHKRNKPIPDSSKKMTLIPDGTELISNPIGSACGFFLKQDHWKIYCFPGVPTEMKLMFNNSITKITSNSSLVEIATLGVSESVIESKISPFLSTDVKLGFQATRRGNIIKLLFLNNKTNNSLIEKIYSYFDKHIFGQNETNLAQIVGTQLLQNKQTISVAESCTGGKISAWITEVTGASRYFKEGIVVYSNESKQRYCCVQTSTLEKYGAVSQQTAVELAQGIRKLANTDWGLAVTGIAGPGGGTLEKPVGTVHIACVGPENTTHQRFLFHGTRNQITESSSAHALFILHKQLTSKNPRNIG
jgi:nicotinamide-nucleotide amidase